MTKMAKFVYQDGGRLDVEIIFISRLQGHQFSGDALLTILPPFVVKKLIDVFSGLCLTFHLAFPLLPLQRDGTVAVFYIKICCNISSASYHNKTFSIVSSVFPPRLSI